MTEEEKASAETAGGYATEMSDDYKRRQAELIAERVKEADFVITTALIPGRPAPKLVTDEMVAEHEAGQRHRRHGGRDGRQRRGDRGRARRSSRHGVRIIGLTNLPATMPGSATQMYAKNIQTLVKHLLKDGTLNLDFDDEITRGATITHGGKVVHEATAKALGIEVAATADRCACGRSARRSRTRSHEGRLTDGTRSVRARFGRSSSSSSPPSSATRSSPRCRPCSTRR